MTTHIGAGTPEVIKTISSRGGLAYNVPVTTATSTTVFASTSLIALGEGNDDFVGWWVYARWDAGAASGAPQGEYRQISDYADSTGTVTHSAFSAQLAVTDVVMLIHPSVYEATAMRGGAQTIQSLHSNQQAGLDFAQVQTIASPVTLSAAAQYIYSDAPGRPFFFAGGLLSWDSGDPADQTVTVIVQTKTDGTNWVTMWTKGLSALPSPLECAVPSGDDEDNSLNIPIGFWNNGSGVRVGISQAAEGGGWQVVSHSFIDGVPRS